ncbi:hypothetical protein SAMN04488061_0902 [Filomicrobium insigne]|uniref:Uncharacterized protein n=1 Tax=Filomicrobium insigne TaxID=418854 RepID=A0A1H0IMZ6_9HYPH|nr:hypothetical protein SAMN04488061_0902 [Filomicrobium insigne]
MNRPENGLQAAVGWGPYKAGRFRGQRRCMRSHSAYCDKDAEVYSILEGRTFSRQLLRAPSFRMAF